MSNSSKKLKRRFIMTEQTDKEGIKTSDAAVSEKKTTGTPGKIAGMAAIVVAAFALGVASSDFFKGNTKKQQPMPLVNSESMPIDPVMKQDGQLQQTSPAAEHQQHIADAAVRVLRASKSGDYSYLYNEPASKEEIIKIDITEAKNLFDSGKAVFVDARGQAEYDLGHIKGAVSVPAAATPEEIAKLKDILAGKVLVTYCHGAGCHLADKSALMLYDAGYRKTAIFFGGWPKWNELSYPTTLK
jgi:rhodanese-related sulfurtransferase